MTTAAPKPLQTALFLISHQPNPRLVKQINLLAENGYHVIAAYFERSSMAHVTESLHKEVSQVFLGSIKDRAYFKRFIVYIRAITRLRRLLRGQLITFSVVSNWDMLLLRLMTGTLKRNRETVILEAADLREYVFRRTPLAWLMKQWEAWLLNRYVHKLIVTSARFYEAYYSRFFTKPHFILENKPLRHILPPRPEKKEASDANIIRIGIVGFFLYKVPYDTLFSVIRARTDVEVHIYGKGRYENLLRSYAELLPNVHFHGEYHFFKEIGRIYSGIDILYAVYDTTEQSLNNRLALPNKLYEAMYFKVPLIVSEGTYLSEIVASLGIGYAVDCTDAAQLDRVLNEFKTQRDAFHTIFEKIPETRYLGDKDYSNLIHFIKN